MENAEHYNFAEHSDALSFIGWSKNLENNKRSFYHIYFEKKIIHCFTSLLFFFWNYVLKDRKAGIRETINQSKR